MPKLPVLSGAEVVNYNMPPNSETLEEVARIRALVEEGLKSGVCKDDARTVLRKIMAKRRRSHE